MFTEEIPAMGTKTGINTVPTDYQAGLLLAALDAERHRIPGDANGRTLDLFYARQWVKEYTAIGRLASTVRDYPGFTHFRLTHHGINAARRVRALRDWSFIPGRFAVLQDDAPTVKARELVTIQGVPRRDGMVKALVVSTQSTRYVPVHHVGPLAIGPDALSLPETAVYVPQDDKDRGTGYRDVVLLKGAPDAEGKIQAISGRYNGKVIRVPLVDLQPIPELAAAPAGDLTDWWSVTDRTGAEVARIQGADDPSARAAAERHPKAGPVSRRENGVAVRRLRTSELETPVGELRGLPRTA
ncbi:hypothetical protein M2271_007210 [Streptomyces sp. LBL]|uniref:hypothetical protein n=1 Tax=Streptomyces sp. LBL TaxID=2940562 RepID=UPI0024756FCE|nr:hypothetical protein [Streptomyces sp. LBL]MDH6629374.1 hypothetical protein [Streptomyces sp. LBL]